MISEIRIQGLKSFKDSGELKFSKVNLLTGKNGRGKSTVMQSILLLAQSFDAEKGINQLELNGRYVKLGTFDDILRSGDDCDYFEICFKTDDEVDNNIGCKFVRRKKNLRIASFHELMVDGDSKMETVISSVLSSGDNKNELSKVSLETDTVQERIIGATSDVMGLRQLLNVVFISADRQGGVDSVTTDIPWDNSMGVGIHGEYVLNMLDAASQEQIAEINLWLQKILEGGSVSTVSDPAKDEISLFIDPAGISKGFKPSNVGFGYSYILSILTALIMSKNNTKVFVENPEAHLHPSAQARLVKTMVEIAEDKNLQLFIESHSDHVLHGLQISVMNHRLDVEDLSVLFFSFDENSPNLTQVNQLEILADGHIRRPPIGFFDQAQQDLSELIGF